MAWTLVLIPVGFALLAPVFRRTQRLLTPLALTALLATLAAAVWVVASSFGAVEWRWGPLFGLRLQAAGFGRVMAVLVPAIACPVIGYALVVEHEARTRLVALLIAFVGAMEMLVLAVDFLTLLIGWELVGALSWALIGHGWRDPSRPQQAAHAFITTRFGDLGLYVAAGAAFAATGDLGFTALDGARGGELQVVAAGVLVAAAAKSAQVPFAPWLFSAMAGPTPVSALLHSATMVAAGAYLVIRLGPVLEPVGWFGPAVMAVGLVTALAGGAVASVQTDAKRVLAGSTSAQYGLMFLAAGAGSTSAAGAHLVTHAAFKALLFLGAGVAIHAAGSGELSRMKLGRALPRVAALSGVGALALAAVPPLGGAWSKEQIVVAAVHASPWLGAGALVAGSLSAFYAARYQLLAYGMGTGPGGLHGRRGEMAPLILLGAVTVLLGWLWFPGSERIVEQLTDGDVLGAGVWELALSIALIATAFGAAWALERAGRLVTVGLPAGARSVGAAWLGFPMAAETLIVDPVLALARALARLDDRVVDAGVRGAAALARLLSRLLSFRVEFGIDAVVRGVGAVTLAFARASRAGDDRGVDAAVEGAVQGVGVAGRRSRRLQTGLSHHYYLVFAGGLAVLVGVLAVAR